MKSIILQACLCLLITSSAVADVTLSGQVVSETGHPVLALVTINGETVQAEDNGSFNLSTSEQNIYSLTIDAEGYYPSIQTFSDFELKAQAYAIAPISLVEHKVGRTLFLFGGDFMMGRRFSKPFEGEPQLIRPDSKLEDAKAILKFMKPYLEVADVAAINLETQVMEEEPAEKAPKSVVFFTPPEALDALKWAGVDYVTLGNNHTYDYLDAGLASTLDALRSRDIAFSGADHTESGALAPYMLEHSNSRYALQGYVGWAGGGRISQVAEGDEKGGPPLGLETNITQSVKRDLATDATPIVQYHGSLEYGDGPSLDTETRLKAAVDAGAGLVVAHHPHVFQGLELYKDKLIAWSLGNFTFDQYFYTAQKSALLYVWMDGDQFHRAEVAPIYLKGYVPTPATGEMRHSIMGRIARLSATRGTILQPSGGHGFVSAGNQGELVIGRIDYHPEQSLSRTGLRWYQSVSGVENLPQNIRYRLGRDLLSRGQFEAYGSFNAPDRSWLDMDETIEVSQGIAWNSKTSLKLAIPSGESVTTGMRKFTRAYKAGNPTSISAMVKAGQTVNLRFFLQRRRTRDRLQKALDENPLIELGQATVEAGNWQEVVVDFDSPRVGTRSYRFLIEATAINGKISNVWIDDLSLVEWQTPWLDGNIDAGKSQNEISHIQFRNTE